MKNSLICDIVHFSYVGIARNFAIRHTQSNNTQFDISIQAPGECVRVDLVYVFCHTSEWISHWTVIMNKRKPKQFHIVCLFSLVVLTIVISLFVCLYISSTSSSSPGYSIPKQRTKFNHTNGGNIKRNLLLSLHHANLFSFINSIGPS